MITATLLQLAGIVLIVGLAWAVGKALGTAIDRLTHGLRR